MVPHAQQLQIPIGFLMGNRSRTATHPDRLERNLAEALGADLHKLRKKIESLAVNRGSGEAEQKKSLLMEISEVVYHRLAGIIAVEAEKLLGTRVGDVFRNHPTDFGIGVMRANQI